MTNEYGDLEASIQEKIDSDNNFQESLTDLSDDEKEQAISEKRSELLSSEIKAMKEAREKAEKNYHDQKIRAEKAEATAKKAQGTGKPQNPKDTPETPSMSLKDIRALNDVPDEDVDEVIDFAKFKGIEIAEAKKDPVVQQILKTRAEERASSEAANTNASQRRSSQRSSDEQLLKKAEEQTLDKNQIQAAAQARIRQMKAKNSNTS